MKLSKKTENKSFDKVINILCLPIRLSCSHSFVEKIGLKSIKIERIEKVLKFCKGSVLDIGCGDNLLIKKYKKGIGIDVYDFGGDALIVKSTDNLPFKKNSFNTITFIASLNHIPHRRKVLKEVFRILKPGGIVIITMLNPFIGYIRHKTAIWDIDQKERGMKNGEKYGLSKKEIIKLLLLNGFVKEYEKKFILSLNNLFIFRSTK